MLCEATPDDHWGLKQLPEIQWFYIDLDVEICLPICISYVYMIDIYIYIVDIHMYVYIYIYKLINYNNSPICKSSAIWG